MNPYAFLAKLAGIGLVAGTAVAMVKLVEKVWPKPDTGDGTFEYIAMAGEFPPEDEEACADSCAAGEDAASEAADRTGETGTADKAAGPTAGTGTEDKAANCTAGTGTEDKAANCSAGTNAVNGADVPAEEPAGPVTAPAAAEESAVPAAVPAFAAAPDTPNANPVDAPPAVPVTDPLKIADPADFQDWDGLGCQG